MGFTMMVHEKMYFRKKYICRKNNTAQLYYIRGRDKLDFSFSSMSKDGSDIHRFFNRKWVLTKKRKNVRVRACSHLVTAMQIFDVVSMSSEMDCIITNVTVRT